jgi:uncharacterized membrane protein YhiD involved in acid resistance
MNAAVAWWDGARSGRRHVVVVLAALVAAALGTVAVAGEKAREVLPATNDIATFTWADLGHALLCLVVAAALGALLALRPRRAGGPPRLAHVVQTQIMLAIIGSLVMLIVGASLARAFAIAGVAGLVRYRSKIDDPKDASVMLACLALGLASGVGLLYLATAGAVFILAVLWVLEWREPWPAKSFELKVAGKDPAALKAEVEALLTRHHITFELRETKEKHIAYSAQVPQGKRTDRISEAIAALHGAEAVDVTWEEKKAVK